MKNNITSLILTVTNCCNHVCRMCYYHASRNKRIQELSLQEFRKISCSLPGIDKLYISGGEPFLRKDLPQICEVFYKNNGTRRFFIPTNGSVPECTAENILKILRIMPQIRLGIMLSLEGLEGTHDDIHGRRGAFRSVLKTLDRLNALRLELLLQDKSFSLSLNTVVTSQNIDEIIPLMDFVRKNLWVTYHTFSAMRGTGSDPECQTPDARAFAKLFRKAKPYFEFYAKKRSLQRPQAYRDRINGRYRLWIDVLGGEKWPFKCQAGNRIGVIEPDGGVRLCELGPVIGNVRKTGYDFNKVWFSKEADEARRKVDSCCCSHACFIDASEEGCSTFLQKPAVSVKSHCR